MAVLPSLHQSLKVLREVSEKLDSAGRELQSKQSELELLQKQQHELAANHKRVAMNLSSMVGDFAAASAVGDKKGTDDQRKRLEREQKELAEQESAAVKKRAAVESQIQAAKKTLVDQRQLRQKGIKDAFVMLKSAIEKCHSTRSHVIQLLVLEELNETIRRSQLKAEDLDEFFDKSFAIDILNGLHRVNEASRAVLNLTDEADVDRWKKLPEEIAATTKSIQTQEENLRTLPGRLQQTELALEQAKRQHLENAPDRESTGSQAKWSILAALGIAAVLVAIGLTGVQPAFYGLALPGVIALFSLVQGIRCAALDLSGQIQQLEREEIELQRQFDNIPGLQRQLATDKQLLAEFQGEFEAIHARHPELRGFQLSQF